jgi:hypothetical protein
MKWRYWPPETSYSRQGGVALMSDFNAWWICRTGCSLLGCPLWKQLKTSVQPSTLHLPIASSLTVTSWRRNMSWHKQWTKSIPTRKRRAGSNWKHPNKMEPLIEALKIPLSHLIIPSPSHYSSWLIGFATMGYNLGSTTPYNHQSTRAFLLAQLNIAIFGSWLFFRVSALRFSGDPWQFNYLILISQPISTNQPSTIISQSYPHASSYSC